MSANMTMSIRVQLTLREVVRLNNLLSTAVMQEGDAKLIAKLASQLIAKGINPLNAAGQVALSVEKQFTNCINNNNNATLTIAESMRMEELLRMALVDSLSAEHELELAALTNKSLGVSFTDSDADGTGSILDLYD